MSFYKGLLFTSLALLFHAAYSAAEWRSYARKSEQVQTDSIPLDITLETVVGLLLAMVAVLKIGGKNAECLKAILLWFHPTSAISCVRTLNLINFYSIFM